MPAPHTAVVLLIGSEAETVSLGLLKSILEQANVKILTADSLPASFEAAAAEAGPRPSGEELPAAVILSLDQRTFVSGVPLSSLLGKVSGDVPIIVAAQDFAPAQIRAILEQGATDFILPPYTPANVLPRVWRLIRHSHFSSSTRGSLREKIGLQRLDLLGESPSFLHEIRKLPVIAKCDVTVMIRGETGTGKELVARALHYLSPRYGQPFVPIDCGAIPPELAESELFGHERGAFTGAVARNPGLISAADQGTIFLDEVDALSLSVQAKFLRFLQQMEYRPLGSNKIKRADVRVIAATNSDLQRRVRDGEFRDDLYYRLNVVQFQLPSLRERREDVPLLAQHFAAKYAARFNRPALSFTRDALQRLAMHQWPGNIRELENVVEAAVVLCDGPSIRAGDLLFAAQEQRPQISFREAKAQTVRAFERDYIVRLLYACGGNVSEASRVAGKNRRALWELIRKHGVDMKALRDVTGTRAARKPAADASSVNTRRVSSC